MEKKYSFILLSAGSGSRVGKIIPKQYLTLAGKPMIVHTLERVDQIIDIDEIIVVCNENYISKVKDYLIQYNIRKKIIFSKGGKTRQESVSCV